MFIKITLTLLTSSQHPLLGRLWNLFGCFVRGSDQHVELISLRNPTNAIPTYIRINTTPEHAEEKCKKGRVRSAGQRRAAECSGRAARSCDSRNGGTLCRMANRF